MFDRRFVYTHLFIQRYKVIILSFKLDTTRVVSVKPNRLLMCFVVNSITKI